MKRWFKKYRRIVRFISFMLIWIWCAGSSAFPEEEQNAEVDKATEISDQALEDQKEAEELEKEAAEVKEIIEQKQKKETVEQSRLEAEKVVKEKEALEQEVELKEQEAALIKEELKVVKEEAEVTKDKEAKKKARALEKEAQKLEKEAGIKKSQLAILESKAELSEQIAARHESSIQELQKALVDLKSQRLAKRSLTEKIMSSAISAGVGFVLLVVLLVGLRKFEHLVTEKDAIRESDRVLRMKTVSALLRWLGVVVILGFIGYSILENFGINMAPLLAGAGIAGLAFGFGGQYLIRDLINGIFIAVEGQYRINDVVKLGDVAGFVEAVNLRVTKLRDLEGRVIYIPNGEIKTVINYTKEYAQALLDIGVAYKENVDQVMDVMRAVGKEMRQDSYYGQLILDDLEMLGVDDFADSAVMIKCRMRTLPIKQWEVSREYRRRLKNRFDELGIEIPFPHRTLYIGTGKDNDWIRAYAPP